MLSILMLGDSLVEWGRWEDLLPEYDIINRGSAGETTEELAARLFDELNRYSDCDVILFQSGTNNLLMGNPHFPAIFSSMIPLTHTLCPQATIALNSLMPMPAAAPLEVEQVNSELRQLAKQTDQCMFVDTVPAFTEQCLPITHPGFLNDNVHLSTRGYQVWARTLDTFFNTLSS